MFHPRSPRPPVPVAAGDLEHVPVRVSCPIHKKNLVHCVVRPERDPPPDDANADAEASRFSYELEYRLDEYQQLACNALRASESVVVSAPTSSGKTTVALAALDIALSRPGGCAVFCAPIKALCNQMFSEFHSRFPGKVGLMTGDHTIAPDNPILVATTEVFRCLLHADGSFAVRLRGVVFDEVHYLSDAERGSAWEDSIILLPPGVPIVCLSATMANPIFLAGWLCQLKGRPVHAVQKKGRPVPLRHKAQTVISGPSGLLDLKDENGKVNQVNIHKAAKHARESHLQQKEKKQNPTEAPSQPGHTKHDHMKQWKPKDTPAAETQQPDVLRSLLAELVSSGQSPVLVFCFNKVECEKLAKPCLDSGLLTQRADAVSKKAEIRKRIEKFLARIPVEERECEQMRWATEHLLPHGLGVHHGGVVPLVREVTELLFKAGLLEVLLCTETFGMGLNMPAKTVAFHFKANMALRKFDGQSQRVLTPTEYQQMSGRAGRRKLDTHGTSILVLDSPFKSQDLEGMLTRPSPPVCSSYEMGASRALHLLHYGPAFLDWFGRQTLKQFESRQSLEPVLGDELARLVAVMKDEELGLLDRDGLLTRLGRACAAVECGDVFLAARLLSQEHLVKKDPLDILACLTAVLLERGRRRRAGEEEEEDSSGTMPEALRHVAETFEWEAQAVDDVIARHQLWRRSDETGWLAERLRDRLHIAPLIRSTWLAGSSFDEMVAGTGVDPGTAARLLRRLDEFAKQMALAMRALGQAEAADSLEAALRDFRRGVPFCESLYFPHELGEVGQDRLGEVLASRLSQAEDCWESQLKPGDDVWLNPCEVGFSHDTIRTCFGPDSHPIANMPLRAVLGRLKREELIPEDTSRTCRVVFYCGKAYTLGNRRLAVLRMLCWVWDREDHRLPFRVASRDEALEWGWRKKFTTGSFGGVRAILRETGEVLGQSHEDSIVSLREDADNNTAIGGQAGRFWDQYDRLPTSVREPEDVQDEEVWEDSRTCFFCGEYGHTSRTCPYSRPTAASKTKAKALPRKAAPAPDLTTDNFPSLAGPRWVPKDPARKPEEPAQPHAKAKRRPKEMVDKATEFCEKVISSGKAARGKKGLRLTVTPDVLALFHDLGLGLPPQSADKARELLTELGSAES